MRAATAAKLLSFSAMGEAADRDRVRDREMLQRVLRLAQEVRLRVVEGDRRLEMRDVYALAYELTKELQRIFPDARIMVGDRMEQRGAVQHHWVEIPSAAAYVDPAGDALDRFQPVRMGKTTDPEFAATYRNAMDANIDVSDPRNRPESLFKAKSAWDTERPD